MPVDEDEKLMVAWIFNKVHYSDDIFKRVLSIQWRSKVVDWSIFIFCLNLKYGTTTIQTLILLMPQWQHSFSIGVVDSLLPYFFFQFPPLIIFNCVGVFHILASCYTKFERPYHPVIYKGDIILKPHISRHIRILRYPYWYGMSPVSQNYINTTSNGVFESHLW